MAWVSPWKAAESLWKDIETSIDSAMGVSELNKLNGEGSQGGTSERINAASDDNNVTDAEGQVAGDKFNHHQDGWDMPDIAVESVEEVKDPATSVPPTTESNHDQTTNNSEKDESAFFSAWGLSTVTETIKQALPDLAVAPLSSNTAPIDIAEFSAPIPSNNTTEPADLPITPAIDAQNDAPPSEPMDAVTASVEQEAPVKMENLSAPSDTTRETTPDTPIADTTTANEMLTSENASRVSSDIGVEAVEPEKATSAFVSRRNSAHTSDITATATTDSLSTTTATDASQSAALTDALARIASLENQLAGREKQVESLSLQTAKALEEVLTLKNSLHSAEMKATKAETSLQQERNKAAKLAKEAGAGSKAADRVAQLEAEVAHRDGKIAEIMSEGEALSKRVGALEASIRQLRSNVKQVEAERDAKKEDIAGLEQRLASMKARMADLEAEAQFARKDKDTASDVANASQSRLASAEEEVNKLRLEVKAMKASLTAAQREAEDNRNLVAKALADAEAAERGQREMEALIANARASESQAARVVAVYEDQIRDLRSQLHLLHESAGHREDDLRREVAELQARLQRLQSNAEDSTYTALAAAYGVGMQGRDAGSPGGKNPAAPSAGLMESLVAQVAALQAELQSKRDSWAASRATLQARIAASESALEAADVEVKRAESAALDAAQQSASLRSDLVALRAAKARTDADLALVSDKLRDADARLHALSSAHDATQRQLLDANGTIVSLRAKLEEQMGSRAAANHMTTVLKEQLVAAQTELLAVKRELAALNANRPESESLSSESPGGLLARALAPASPKQLEPGVLSGHSATQAAFFAAVERERDLLVEKVNSLSLQLASLQDVQRTYEEMRSQFEALTAQQAVTLELLGEREEELEALKSELEDVKEVYRVQLEALMLQNIRQSDT